MECLACAALTFLARRRHEVRQFTPLEDIDEMKSAVSHISSYSCHIDGFAPFDMYVLDKMEAVLQQDGMCERRYADDLEIRALLTELGLTALMLHPGHLESSLWLPNDERFVGSRLQTFSPDVFLLRWAQGRYEHYAGVADGENSMWKLLPSTSSRVRDALASLATVQAFLADEKDRVRDLVLRDLGHVLDGVGGAPSCSSVPVCDEGSSHTNSWVSGHVETLSLSGINVPYPWAHLILAGEKTLEIRPYDLGYRGIGQRDVDMWLCQRSTDCTGDAMMGDIQVPSCPDRAEIVGIVRFSHARKYQNLQEYQADRHLHRIREGGANKDWDGKGKLYAWHIVSTRRLVPPITVPSMPAPGWAKPRLYEGRFWEPPGTGSGDVWRMSHGPASAADVAAAAAAAQTAGSKKRPRDEQQCSGVEGPSSRRQSVLHRPMEVTPTTNSSKGHTPVVKRKRRSDKNRSPSSASSSFEAVATDGRRRRAQVASFSGVSSDRGQVQNRSGPRVVSIHSRDPLGDTSRREAQALDRHRRERQQGERGRAVDFQGQDLDRSAGGAFQLTRR